MKTLLNLDARWPIYTAVDIDLRRISPRAGGLRAEPVQLTCR